MLPWHWFSSLKVYVQIPSIFWLCWIFVATSVLSLVVERSCGPVTAEPSLVDGAWALERDGFSSCGLRA